MAKCRDRLCNLVIDGGREINVISQEVIDKLKLPTEKHLKPYKVSWVNDSTIPVTKRCQVTFRIGGYEDSIWCDIIPMNVTHILLGRPWLFYNKVQSDGEANTHTFKYKGHNVTLLPLKPPTASAKQSPSIPAKQTASQPSPRILSMRKFEEESKEQGVVYALIPQEFKEAEDMKAVSTPPEIKSFLHDFKDLIPVDLPKELPSMRNILHAIYLVPASSLPNLPAYRMSPTKHGELKRQVEELL